MFYYFGRKGRAAKSYPAPEYPLVIEPFAGSMGYTLTHRPRFAIGIEKDQEVYDLWHRLCSMSKDEIRDFPVPAVGTRSYDRWVIVSSQSNSNSMCSYRTMTEFMVDHFNNQRGMALRHHDYARSVSYVQGDYREAPDVEATWFIDPPYVGIRDGYKHGPKEIDYDELAKWCMTRRGQVIICEGPDGSWLPFQHHSTWQGTPTFKSNSKPIVEHTLVRRTHARCDNCSTTFPATRSDARFCSARCRQAGSRKSRNT